MRGGRVGVNTLGRYFMDMCRKGAIVACPMDFKIYLKLI
jgi:hypothetical protein